MPNFDLRSIRIEPLKSGHDRSAFRCGVPALDRYLVEQAGQDAKRRIAAPFVALDVQARIVGFYTLSATSIRLADLPVEYLRRLPRYPNLPATLLGHLATDLSVQGMGRFLLVDAMRRAVLSEIASFALIVDAKDDSAANFYERESFLPLNPERRRLMRRMVDIAALFD